MNFQRVKALIKKEVFHILRDPRTLFLVLLLPLLQLILFGYALSFDVENLPTALCDLDKSMESRAFKDAFLASKYFKLVKETNDPEELGYLLDQGAAKVTIFIPKGFSKHLKESQLSRVQILIDGSDPTFGRVAYGYSQTIVKMFNLSVSIKYLAQLGQAKSFKVPIEVSRRVYFNPTLESVNFIVPGLIAIFLVIIPTVITSVAIVREKEMKTIDQLTVTPLKPFEIVVGKTTPYLLLAFTNAFLVTTLGTLWFKVPLKGSPWLLTLMIVLYLLSTVGLGLLISTIAQSQQVAMLSAMFSTYLPSILLSGFIFPIKSMPRFLQLLSYAVPTKYFIFIIRGIFLKGVGIPYFLDEVLMLALFSLLIGLVAFIALKRTAR
jgi:ABC-2 type transport system permease protein